MRCVSVVFEILSLDIVFAITLNRTHFKSDGMVRLSGFGSKTAHFVGGRKKRIISVPSGPFGMYE